jgi:hypothetical protein
VTIDFSEESVGRADEVFIGWQIVRSHRDTADEFSDEFRAIRVGKFVKLFELDQKRAPSPEE